MHFRVTVVTFCLLVTIAMASSPPNDVDPCSWQSKTQPDSLKGNQGTSPKDAYWFRHVSDVDKYRQKNYFIFAIKNNHAVNYLPAEWMRGNGHAQISFERIAPEGCGANDFETSLPFKEDPKAVIKYAPAKQNKKDAPLYQTADTSKREGERQGPRLKSRIIADVQGEDKNKHRINLEFTAATEGRYFEYTATNLGTKDQLFIIPAFSSAWEKMGRSTKIEYESRWMTRDGAFVARGNREAQRHVLRVGAAKGFLEMLVQVQVLSSEGKPMAAGQITVYLPSGTE